MPGITVIYDLVTEFWYCDTVHCDNCTEKNENKVLARPHKKSIQNRKNSTKELRNKSQTSQISLSPFNVKYIS